MEGEHEETIVDKFSSHGLVISKHIDVLLNNINLSELLPYLYAKNLVSEEEWLSMPATPLAMDARSVTERVLGRLMDRESAREDFVAFIQCLKDSSGHLPHKELANVLEKPFLADDEEEVTSYGFFFENPACANAMPQLFRINHFTIQLTQELG